MVKVVQGPQRRSHHAHAAEYDQWLKVAQKSSYAEFAKDVPDGKKLIDEALSVK